MKFYLTSFVFYFSTMLGLEPSTADEANLILVEIHSISFKDWYLFFPTANKQVMCQSSEEII